MKHFNLERYAFEHQQQCFVAHRLSQLSQARLKLRIATPSTMRAVAVAEGWAELIASCCGHAKRAPQSAGAGAAPGTLIAAGLS